MIFSAKLKRAGVVLADFGVLFGGYWLAFLLRFDFNISAGDLGILLHTTPYILAAYFPAFFYFSLYSGIYHFSSFSDLLNITKGVGIGALLSGAAILFVLQGQFPRSIFLLHPILTYLGVGAVRFGIRLAKDSLGWPHLSAADSRRTLLIGAGELGESLLRQMLKTPEPRYRVVGFLDDDPAKWGLRIHGYRVLGGCRDLPQILERQRVDEIVIAMGSRRGDVVRRVVEALRGRAAKPELKIASSLEEMLQAPGAVFALRRVNPVDLLNRGVARLDTEAIGRFLMGKVLLVSGAGGTIGSELCRQALHYGPRKIVLLENNATGLFYAEAKLKEQLGSIEIVPVLGSIRDGSLVSQIFGEHRPQIILHAAAHKHVSQLESNIREGIANNILGTYSLAQAACSNRAEAFVLVSTDKAARPRSVMGATKLAAEAVVQHFSLRVKSPRFLAVRFGNVLGSSGSVLRIFEDQIAAGGPVTVTHSQARRYFMTVEEAVRLIFEAAALARGGEIFALKMGTSVRILDMAKNLILLSGLEPDKDIEIRIVGLRPGEKIEEEPFDPQGFVESGHPQILVLHAGRPLEDLEQRIEELEGLIEKSSPEELLSKLEELAPDFVAKRGTLSLL
jgi:FlaA1/EpsC-like NDP-sugar epimerase